MAELQALEDWAGALLRRLEPTAQRRLLTTIARELRRSNAQRMRAQQDPEGSAWEPRKPPGPALRSQREKLRQQARQRQPMFTKLRAAKHLKARGQGASAIVQFIGRAQRIAAVHHFGLRDRVNPGGPMHDYPARELLGISEADRQRLADTLLVHLRS